MRAHNAEEYADQLHQLMPRGLAWSREKDSSNCKLIAGEGEELARIEARAVYLCLYEFYARTTRELLPEWEEEWGLPDPCRVLGATYEERIEDLLRKMRSIGGQSIAYLIAVAKSMGIDITITEFKPFRVGKSRVGERLYDRKWRFVFRVLGPKTRILRFRVGRNCAGDRLRMWRGLEALECIINLLKPAHTYAIIGYQEE